MKGGKIKNLSLSQPEINENYYEDLEIYALAIRNGNNKHHTKSPADIIRLNSDNPDDPTPFSTPGKDFRSEKPCFIQYEYEKPFTLRSLVISPAGNNFQAQRFSVYASQDGINYQLVKQLTPPRQGWQNTGFTTTFAVKPTTARFFRLIWTPVGTPPGSEEFDAAKWKPTLKVRKIELSDVTRIDNWEGKSGIVWRIAAATTNQEIPTENCPDLKQVIRLKAFFKNGKLTCKLPKGNWRIIRMGHTSTGQTNATGGAAKGLECDKFSKEVVQKQFDNWIGKIFENTDPEITKRVFKRVEIDSWECGSQNWSSNFAEEFKSRRGYDLMPYLPLMAGFPIENAEKSEQVLHDVRQTIAELVNDVFFSVIKENIHKHGCELMTESVAPTFVSDGLLHFKNSDRPMGEFWFRSPTHDKPNDILDAISGAHIYGKNIVQAEGFTQLRTTWDEHPALLKTMLDRNFALGINKLFFHVFVQNPDPQKAPGATLSGMGLFFQANQTWWKQGKAFVDYISRCQTLLQYGKPVVDIAVFTGEEIPSRALTPDKLVTLMPGLVGKDRVESEIKRHENEGQPLAEMPAGVFYAANTYKAENWINPLNGYAYDSFNKDILMNSNKLSDYKAVIFPEGQNYSKETLAKIEDLKKSGINIPQLPFNSKNPGFEPDVEAPENIVWAHRSGDEAEIYFISNQEEKSRNIELSFRISDRTPELWQAIDGSVVLASEYTFENGRTKVKLKLPPNVSVFVVFPKVNNTNQKEISTKGIETTLNLKWKIHFEKNDQKLETTELKSWSENENPMIRYYSGTATYKAQWNQNNISGKYYLDLGKVCNLATVRLNGIDCGTVWTMPYRVDISKALKKGNNEIEIEVTNTWANAINGSDKGTPPFPDIWTDGKYRMKEDKLLEAGLIGPLTLIQK